MFYLIQHKLPAFKEKCNMLHNQQNWEKSKPEQCQHHLVSQTDGQASVRDLFPNFRAPRTSMPMFSLLIQAVWQSAVFPLRGEQTNASDSEQALALV